MVAYFDNILLPQIQHIGLMIISLLANLQRWATEHYLSGIYKSKSDKQEDVYTDFALVPHGADSRDNEKIESRNPGWVDNDLQKFSEPAFCTILGIDAHTLHHISSEVEYLLAEAAVTVFGSDLFTTRVWWDKI